MIEEYDLRMNEERQTEIEDLEYGSSTGILDSKTSLLDDALNEKLSNAFHKQTSQVVLHDVAKITLEYDPIDIAYAVTRLPSNSRVVVYDNLPDLRAKSTFMINTSRNTRAAIFRQIDDEEIRKLVEQMPPDEAVWVLDDLSDRRLKRILDGMDPKKAVRIRELQKHDRHSAGRLMSNEFFAFHMNTTIGDVQNHIRDNPGIELTRSIFVLTDDNELAGYVPDRNLIISQPYITLRHVMRPILHKVSPDASRDEVVDLVERYKIPALPVVEDDKLLGVISYEDVVEAMEGIADATIANIAGTAEDVSEHEPMFTRFVWRAPWLLVTLCAGLFTATAMAHFKFEPWFAFVPFFAQLIAGMSGNVGIVCSTVLVRGISTGELSVGSRREAVAKELGIGLMIGVFFGILCGGMVILLEHFGIFSSGSDHPIALGLTVSSGLFFACLVATCLGSFTPFLFAHLRIDPAVASGPIVTAFNDVLSILMFVLVARIVYPFLSVYMA